MLHDGLYEQIINKGLETELSVTDKLSTTAPIDSAEASKVLAKYIAEVVEKGLDNVADNGGDVSSQVALANRIISTIITETKENELDEMTVAERAEQLLALFDKKNSILSLDEKAAIIRPETSIAQSSLFTGAIHEPQMFTELKKEIISCNRIDMLVSFIKWSGLRLIMDELTTFTQNGGELRIITTSYMGATDVKAIEELRKLPNTKIKVSYDTKRTRLHAKTYVFYRDTGFTTAYVGSSNLSNAAISSGLEWNVKVTKKDLPETIDKIEATFESYWNSNEFEYYNEDQKERLARALKSEKYFDSNNAEVYTMDITPYSYQQEILDKLEAERKVRGYHRNLVVAATGTGKTVISALDYKRFRKQNPDKPCRLLFVAHREEILKQSMYTFRAVLKDANFGEMFVGSYKPESIDNLFISIQTFNSQSFTEKTTSDFYDYIIVDEFHHAAAPTYQKLLSYYNPQILLGLTATPERMDGKSILPYFNNRIAAEIRLSEAIDRKLLCPFQYFGVTDTVDLDNLKWAAGGYDKGELSRIYTLSGVMANRRADLVVSSLLKYVTDIDDVKGLGFCVSIEHAKFMSNYFNGRGIPSMFLTGHSPDEERKKAKERLMKGDVRFVFVVDIYNEGVDIPEVNTVLFLRPTESLTVFLQQLGRGLRLSEGKECLMVLDFIGQANKKYNFAMKFEAIVGKGRKSIRKQVEDGFSNLPRGCYIELEKYAKEYILENLKQTDNNKRALIEMVRTFEEDTGLPLNLENFLLEYNMSLYDFYQNTGARSLFRLKKWAGIIEDDKIYSMMTGFFHVNSARLLDYWIRYIDGNKVANNEEERIMRNMLYYTFYKKNPAKCGFQSIDEGIESVLKETFVRDEVLQILKYNRKHISFVAGRNEYSYLCPLDLHCRYNTNQIMAAFGLFTETESPEFREGVKRFEDKKTDIFFINLNKSEKDFSPSTMYEDYAINDKLFHWQSQSQDRQASAKIQRYINHKNTGDIISLFVREFKRLGSYTAPYTFLGNADYVKHEGERPVSFVWKLHNSIPADMLPKANKSIAL